jgi:hypothetical protein
VILTSNIDDIDRARGGVCITVECSFLFLQTTGQRTAGRFCMQALKAIAKLASAAKQKAPSPSVPWFDEPTALPVEVEPLSDDALLDGLHDPEKMTRKELQVCTHCTALARICCACLTAVVAVAWRLSACNLPVCRPILLLAGSSPRVSAHNCYPG